MEYVLYAIAFVSAVIFLGTRYGLLWYLGTFGTYSAQRVIENVYRVDAPLCNGTPISKSTIKNAYLVLQPNGSVTVIDPNILIPVKGFKKALADIGKEIKDIGTILCTHHHVDHAGTAKDLSKLSGAQVYISVHDAPYINGEKHHAFTHAPLWFKIVVHVLLRCAKTWWVRNVFLLYQCDYVPGLKGYTVMETPGHTPGCISFINNIDGIIFTGDAIQQGNCPFTMDPEEEKRSMDLLSTLSEIHTVLPGDGAHWIGDAQQHLPKLRSL